jgi:hypothetical protein
MAENKNIELRSEKVRNIVGQIPPTLLRQGTAIISVIIIILFITAYFVPYPETTSIDITLQSIPNGELIISPRKGIIKIQCDSTVINKNQLIAILEYNNNIDTLYSLVDGKLISNCTNNNIVSQGDILFFIVPNIEEIYAIGYYSSKNNSKLKQGQTVYIELDGYPLNIQGAISTIYPIIETKNSIKLIKFKISFPKESVRNIPFPYSITGKGIIVLSNVSILKRLFFLLF